MKNTADVTNRETSKHKFVNKSFSLVVMEITIQIKHHLFYDSLTQTPVGEKWADLCNQYF